MDLRDSFVVPPHWIVAGTRRRWNRYERIAATDNFNGRASVFLVEAGAVYYWTVMVEYNGYAIPGLTFPWSTVWGACRCADRVLDDLFAGDGMTVRGDQWASHQIARWYSYRNGVDGKIEAHFVQTAADVIEFAQYFDGKLQEWGAEQTLNAILRRLGIAAIRPIWRKITPDSYRLSIGFGAGQRLVVDLYERQGEPPFWTMSEGYAPVEQGDDARSLTEAIAQAEGAAGLFIAGWADKDAASAGTLARRSVEQIIAAGFASYER